MQNRGSLGSGVSALMTNSEKSTDESQAHHPINKQLRATANFCRTLKHYLQNWLDIYPGKMRIDSDCISSQYFVEVCSTQGNKALLSLLSGLAFMYLSRNAVAAAEEAN